MFFWEEGNGGLGIIDSGPVLKRMGGNQQIFIAEINFVAAKTEIVTKIAGQRALQREVGRQIPNGDVVGRNFVERAVDSGVRGHVMVQIVSPRGVTLKVHPGQEGKEIAELIGVGG